MLCAGGRSRECKRPRGGLTEAVEAFEKEYIEYVGARNCQGLPMLDPAPRVILVPGVGMFTTGRSAEEAPDRPRCLYRGDPGDRGGRPLGDYASLTPDQAFDAEYSRLGSTGSPSNSKSGELAGKMALVTGAARGIGRAVVQAAGSRRGPRRHRRQRRGCAMDWPRGAGRSLPGRCFGVTHGRHPAEAFKSLRLLERGSSAFGGLDILVSNAGIACRPAAVIDMPLAVWEKSFAVNTTGHFLVSREAVRVMKAQGVGGAIVFNCTKTWWSRGPSSGVQLRQGCRSPARRILALEHGRDKIRRRTW